ncbi:PREDICTED: arginyl-tRNA--protein transferase 1 isoform X3 [Cyphomyrmex costatus]|uniref:Arginyl-tRNA--protein transferase 1 n=1 Tax=Cyphomyrmex costatus TaxID=456900 RepID=A0A151IG37_9HYME|nr:PREDICTED: arginyl-tRNA--protein transferase 1 isoform X3 [Cyphomyrmex costatus]KYN00160.1 Arginyl-tRNA--protein transferase 1 [Cyphomyrmex costatus]
MAGRQSYSIVEYYAEHEGYRCGYCKKSNTNFSHGMWAHSLTVHDYQSLIDRGWRRSGCYCYKPMMNQTCCPQYTIKCEALDFKISKSQKKILKRMTKFLKNELTKDNVRGTDEDQQDNIDISNEEALNYSKHLKRAQKDESQINILSVDDKVDERLSVNLVKTETQKNPTSVSNSSQAQLTTANSKNSLHVRNEIVNVVPCKKAKLLRIERKKNKLLAQGKSQSEIESIMRDKKQQNCIRTVEELFEEVYTGLKKLELRLVRTAPMSSEYRKTSKESYELYKKYQNTIHGVPPEKLTEQHYMRFLVKSPLQMKLVRVMSDEFLNTLETSANLYKKYQMTIHGDTPEQCDQKAFYNFLVKSPLQQWIPDNGPSHGYGSFHEQYWLDNELVAVGVIDILPSCISSVYFFYDPTYSQLSLGTFSSLREIYLTRQLNKVASNLEYYYMGYYIHSCQKMRYKARMQPSKLLCPETYVWCNIEPCLAKLNNEKYCRLNDEINAIDENGVVDINEVLILYKNIAMPYEKYKTLRKTCHTTQEERREVEEYAKFIGMPCARRMLLYRYSRE